MFWIFILQNFIFILKFDRIKMNSLIILNNEHKKILQFQRVFKRAP